MIEDFYCFVDFAAPFTVTKDTSKSSCDEGSISMIESMGFTRAQAVTALQATVRSLPCKLILTL